MNNSRPRLDRCYCRGLLQSRFSEWVSGKFQTYLELSRLAAALNREQAIPEEEWRAAVSERDRIAEAIARRRAVNLDEVFEKLFIWRVECLERDTGEILDFNDLFPLSAYFDLKTMLGEPEICPESDDALLRILT